MEHFAFYLGMCRLASESIAFDVLTTLGGVSYLHATVGPNPSLMHQSPPRKLCLNEGTRKPSIVLFNVPVYNHIFMNPIVPESLIRLLDNFLQHIHDEHPKISSIETIPFA